MHGLDPTDKSVRVFNFHRHTVSAFAELLGASGLHTTAQITRALVSRRVASNQIKTYSQLFPTISTGALLKPGPGTEAYKFDLENSSADRFGVYRPYVRAA
jgi:hypothetical protein